MKSDRINRIVKTFHDFNLVDIYSIKESLCLCFICYWNEMNDEVNPLMNFKFIFEKSNVIEYELFYELFKEAETIKCYFNKDSDNTNLYKKLIEAEIYFNNCQYINDEYIFGCFGNQVNSEIVGAFVKINFNSDKFIILDKNEKKLTESEYLKLYNDWWNFVKKDK